MLTTMVLAVASLCTAVPADKADFYVAPGGKDTNSGTLEDPLGTVHGARNAVRARLEAGQTANITVYFRAGVYLVEDAVTFTSEDGGSKELRITYASYPGEQARISGGRVITGWEKGKNNRWTVSLPEVQEGTWRFRQLFVDGQRLPRGRFPNAPALMRVAGVSEDLTGIVVDAASSVENLAGMNAELVMFQNWSISRAGITSSNDRTIKLKNPMGWIGHGPATCASTNKPTYIENALPFVDVPGEWYLDTGSGVLTYQAAEGEDPNTRRFVAPVSEGLLAFEGTPAEPIQNVHFDGIDFAHTRWERPAFGYMGIQAGHYGTRIEEPTYVLPLAVSYLYSEGCSITRARLEHLGASGVGLGAGARGIRVERCTFTDIGGSGVMVGWRGVGEMARETKDEDSYLSADWTRPEDVPLDNVITGNLIERCGAINHGCVGIFDAFADGTQITRNVVRNLPYTGISSGFRWNESKTSQKEGVIAYNHVYDTMKMLADGGCLYTLGFQPGAIIRGNVLHSVHRSGFAHGGAPNNGIFFDQGSKGFLVEDNTIHDTSGEPIRFNQTDADNMTWRGNYLGSGADSVVK